MLTRPDWLSALDWAALQQALDTAEAPFVAEGVALRRRYASQAAAIQAALAVLEVGAQVLHHHRERQTAETLHATAERWRDEVIVWADSHRPSGITLEVFATMVNHVLDTCHWWTPFQAAGAATLAEQLDILRHQARWTVEKLAEMVHVDKSNVQDHLTGKTTPRLDNVRQYEAVFSKALQRKIKLRS